MKLETARALFLVGGLVVTSLAVAAWEQPRMQVLSTVQAVDTHCPLPRVARTSVAAKPDHDLLLFMFGLSQGLKPQS